MKLLSVDVGRKNLAMCLLETGAAHARGRADVVRGFKVLDLRQPTCAAVRDVLRAQGIHDWLAGGQVDEVVIERQPLKNPTMTRLQHYLEMYCAMTADADMRVTTLDPKHKLAFAANTPWWPEQTALEGAWTYHKRKKLSALTAAGFFGDTEQPDEARAAWADAKKKDDLADCLLQGMAYAHHVRALDVVREASPPATRVVARKPAPDKLARLDLTKSGLKWLARSRGALASREAFDAWLDAPAPGATAPARKRLLARVDKLFGGPDAAFAALSA